MKWKTHTIYTTHVINACMYIIFFRNAIYYHFSAPAVIIVDNYTVHTHHRRRLHFPLCIHVYACCPTINRYHRAHIKTAANILKGYDNIVYYGHRDHALQSRSVVFPARLCDFYNKI